MCSDSYTTSGQFQAESSDFKAQLPGIVAEIEAACAPLSSGEWNPEANKRMQLLLHKLAGSSLTLGFNRIGEAARALESILVEVADEMGRGGKTAQIPRALVASRLAELKSSISMDTQDGARDLDERISSAITAVQSRQEARASHLIYLFEDDSIQAKELASQVGYFGYAVQIFNQLDELKAALDKEIPQVILMDVVFPDSDMAGIRAVEDLQNNLPQRIPVIFISINDSIDLRLKAVRAGGEGFFTKPVDIGALIELLDRLTFDESAPPFRILIVDDSRVQAHFHALQLNKIGMATEIVTEPLQIMPHLTDFNPDLILLDMYMPDCTGMELARVIRQMETFVSVPIVYLSSETDREKQMRAVGLGADDFLAKPIKPGHLIAAVTSRVERYRKLRSLMSSDSLTGLLNHVAIKERLAQEVARANRQKYNLTYAMIDLDHFKMVNDSYGHAAGDRVLKSVAQLLNQRLRKSDVLGRYGGEEFAVILPGATGKMAVTIMEELRTRFAKILHRAGKAAFSVTFSVGIADYPLCSTPSALSAAADRALYQAKEQGRNQVVYIEHDKPRI